MCLHLAIELMGRCSKWSQVAGEMEAYVKKHHYSVVESFVGHGIGRDMHEDPQVPNFVSRQMRHGTGDFRLVPGLVIAIEPMVNIGTKRVRTKADHWTQSTADGRPSAHFEHTIATDRQGTVDSHRRRQRRDLVRSEGMGGYRAKERHAINTAIG